MDRRKRVMNLTEAAVDSMLDEYAKDNGYRINLKMRLRDAIDLDDVPLTPRERNFAFTAHLDFVAFDSETHLPVLAVEYDGPQHLVDDSQIERDQIKNRLCEIAELPLLRIDNLFARKEGKWRVLTYILWAHETGKEFREAQGRGDIPWDEPFDHAMLMTPHESGRGYEAMGLAIPALRYVNGFRTRHQALWEARWWRGAGNRMESRLLLALPTGLYLFAECATRDFAIEGISALEISEELATAELGWLAQQYDAGDAVAIGAAQGAQLLDDIGPLAAGSTIRSVTGWNLFSTWGPADMTIPPTWRVPTSTAPRGDAS